jgi:hypothetical protein
MRGSTAENSRHMQAKFTKSMAKKTASMQWCLTRNLEIRIKTEIVVINESWHGGCNQVFNGEANKEWRSRKTRNGDRK